VKHTGGSTPGEDLQRLIDTSRPNCPFCPERLDEETPTFDPSLFPEKRLQIRECVLFPNKSPYGQYHAVGTLSCTHYIHLDAFTEETLQDSLDLAQAYFLAVHKKDPEARFPVYVWNSLPPSAGSIVHPHVQLLLESRPAPIIESLEARCRAWRKLHREAFWDALIREELQRNERMIWHQEDCTILASFAPRGFREILILFPGSGSLAHLNQQHKEAFSWALVRLLRAYHAMGVASFNLVTYSPPMDHDPPAFPFHARIISRPYPSGIYTNDTGFFERMYDLWIIDTLPEEITQRARQFFP
jgi:galactose-1-phosphate uridylyltransferase